MRRRADIEHRSLQRARGHRQCGLRQHREKEQERMRANADGTRDEQDRDQARADRLEFCEAERVSSTGRPTGQPPRKQNDKVAQKVCRENRWYVSKGGGSVTRRVSGGCVSSVKVDGLTRRRISRDGHAGASERRQRRPHKHIAKHPLKRRASDSRSSAYRLTSGQHQRAKPPSSCTTPQRPSRSSAQHLRPIQQA